MKVFFFIVWSILMILIGGYIEEWINKKEIK